MGVPAEGPPGGGPLMSVAGTYRTIDPPALLVYTWRWDTGPAASDHESLVTVEFADLGDGRTEVVVTHERFPADHDAPVAVRGIVAACLSKKLNSRCGSFLPASRSHPPVAL